MMLYLTKFFAEKDIPFKVFEIEDNYGTLHVLDTEVVVEFIMNLPHDVQVPIANMLRKIDFVNGNVVPFLEHIAKGMVNLDA